MRKRSPCISPTLPECIVIALYSKYLRSSLFVSHDSHIFGVDGNKYALVNTNKVCIGIYGSCERQRQAQNLSPTLIKIIIMMIKLSKVTRSQYTGRFSTFLPTQYVWVTLIYADPSTVNFSKDFSSKAFL